MKLVTAYIRPERLNDVKRELYAAGIYTMSVTNVLGSGRQKGFTETYRGVVIEVNLLKKMRLEVGIPATKFEEVIRAIMKGARTGKEGDGVVFVQEIEASYRIRTGEEAILASPALEAI